MECVLQEEMGPPMPREAWPPGMPPQHYRGGPRPPHPASMEGVSGSPVNELGQCLTRHAGWWGGGADVLHKLPVTHSIQNQPDIDMVNRALKIHYLFQNIKFQLSASVPSPGTSPLYVCDFFQPYNKARQLRQKLQFFHFFVNLSWHRFDHL